MVAVGAGLLPVDLIELLSEDAAEPLQVAWQPGLAREEQQPRGIARRVGGTYGSSVKCGILKWRDRAPAPIRCSVRGRKEIAAVRVQHVKQRVGPVVEADGERRRHGRGHPMPADGNEGLLAGGPHEAERLSEVQHVREPLQRMLRAIREIGVAEKALEEAQARLEPSVGRGGDGARTDAAVAVSSVPWPGAWPEERGWKRRYSGAGP